LADSSILRVALANPSGGVGAFYDTLGPTHFAACPGQVASVARK